MLMGSVLMLSIAIVVKVDMILLLDIVCNRLDVKPMHSNLPVLVKKVTI